MKLYSKKIVALGVFAALVVGACGDDEADKDPSAGGSCTVNGTLEEGEECDTNVGSANCNSATMGTKPNGTLTCGADCRFVVTGCTGAMGGGGTGGAGG